MYSIENPFGETFDIESNITVQCDNCRHFTILPYYYDKELDIERETAKIKHQHKDNTRIQHQCELIPEIYRKYRRHPKRIIGELILSYWSAWSYEVANQNGVDDLIGHCYNCDKLLEHERLATIKDIICNERG